MEFKVTTAELREMLTDPKKGQQGEPCDVCGKHAGITELHHVVPVSMLARMIELGLPIKEVTTPVSWLCPNCHAYFHAADKNINRTILSMDEAGYSEDQILTMANIFRARDETVEKLMKKILEGAHD